MRVEDIEILIGDADRPYRVIGPISARVTSGAAWNKARTLEDASSKLREVALRMGANAVINVRYERGISATSWKALTAHGTAVVIESSSDIVWTKTGFEYLLGYTLGSPSYGIWHRDQLGMPKHRFPYSEHGKAEALSMFGTLEPNAEDVPPPLPPRP